MDAWVRALLPLRQTSLVNKVSHREMLGFSFLMSVPPAQKFLHP